MYTSDSVCLYMLPQYYVTYFIMFITAGINGGYI